MATGPKGKWGGRRSGSGRKPQIVEKEFKRLLAAIKSEAKEMGLTWQEWFAKQMLGKDKERSARFAKMFMDQMKIGIQETSVTVNDNRAPAVYLPEEKPDPAKVRVVQGGK